MPEPDEGGTDPNVEAATAQADDLGAEGSPETDGGGEGVSPNGDPYKDMSRETVIAMYNAEKANTERYSELQGKVDALLAQRQEPAQQEPANKGSALDDRLAQMQTDFNTEWGGKIEAEPGKNTVAYVQAAFGELIEAMRSEIAEARGESATAIFEQSAEYQANREKVDAVAKEAGLSKPQALKVLKSAGVITAKTRQPGTPKAPGRTKDGAAPAAAAATGQKLAGFERESVAGTLRMAGYDDKEIAAEIGKIESEMAESAGGGR